MDVRQGRWTAEIDGDFVVFIIGARLNSKLHAFKAFIGPRRPPRHDPHAQVPDATPGEGTARLPDGRPHRSSSTGDPSSTSRRLPRTRTIRILRSGATTGGGSARAPHRHLARDVPRPRGRVRGDLRQHASARPRQGGKARSRRRICRAHASESRPHVSGESLGARSTVVDFHVVGVQTVEEVADRPLGSEHVNGDVLPVLRDDLVFPLRF